MRNPIILLSGIALLIALAFALVYFHVIESPVAIWFIGGAFLFVLPLVLLTLLVLIIRAFTRKPAAPAAVLDLKDLPTSARPEPTASTLANEEGFV